MKFLVFNGYGLIEPPEASANHVLVFGSEYYKVPSNAFRWEIGHGTTGWWREDEGKPMKKEIYSIPKDSKLFFTDPYREGQFQFPPN